MSDPTHNQISAVHPAVSLPFKASESGLNSD